MRTDEVGGVVARVKSAAPHLTPTLRRIAEYTLANPDRVMYHSITELAEAAQSSEGSIIRFCRDLGYGGFQHFKLQLALDLGKGASSLAPEAHDRETDSLVEWVCADSISAIRETRQLLDPAAIDTAASRLLDAKSIDIYGVGASGMTADYLGYKLTRLGLNARARLDPHLAAMSAANLDHSSVAVGVSSSGSTMDTLRALEEAKSAGAFTISIVNRLKSPIATFSDCVLLASSHESPLSGGAAHSKVSQFVVIEVLLSVLTRDHTGAQEALTRTAEAVASKSV